MVYICKFNRMVQLGVRSEYLESSYMLFCQDTLRGNAFPSVIETILWRICSVAGICLPVMEGMAAVAGGHWRTLNRSLVLGVAIELVFLVSYVLCR
jgi:hypothetical protein